MLAKMPHFPFRRTLPPHTHTPPPQIQAASAAFLLKLKGKWDN